MGKPIEKIAHPSELGGCGSSDALQVFQEEDGSYNGFCYSCKKYVHDPYAQHPEGYKPPLNSKKTPEQVQEEINDIRTYPVRAIPDRGILKDTCEHFDVRVGVSTANGTDIESHYYPYSVDGEITAYNVRICDPKKFFGIGSRRNSLPFGWDNRAKTKALYITEGELDAMSLYQILKQSAQKWTQDKGKQWDDRYVPDIISLPTGASSASRVLAELADELERTYREVRLVFDQDDAGKRATQDAVTALGGRKIKLFVAMLPKKDVNECLQAGLEQDVIKSCVYNASEKISGKVLRSNELWNQAKERPKQGAEWPWQTLTDLTRGQRLGEVYYWGAGVKMGKSVIVDMLAANDILTKDSPIFLCKPEEQPHHTAQRLAGKAVQRIFWDPNVPFDQEAFEQGRELIGDKAIIYDNYQKTSWDDVKREIRHAVLTAGVQNVYIDPLTCFTVGISSGEANDVLIEIASEFASMAKNLKFTGQVFCHLNKPASGLPHERGGKVESSQFAGSRAMARFCHAMFGLEGNKDPDLPLEERNTRRIVLLEDRNFGATGAIPLHYNSNTGMLAELPKGSDHD